MMIAGKPVGEVQQKARKESGLGGAQQEADDGEGHRTRDQGGQAGDDTPADPVHVRAVSRTEARRRVPVLFPTPAYPV